jgi:TonB family protein
MSLHHAFAQWAAWFWPMLTNHIWEATLIALAALLASKLLSKASTRARSLVWSAAMAKFILPSIVLLWPLVYFTPSPRPWQKKETMILIPAAGADALVFTTAVKNGIAASGMIARPLPVPIDPSHTGVEKRHNEICCALTIVWLLGALWAMSRWLLHRRRFRRRLKSAMLVTSTRERETLNRLQARVGLSREVRLVESTEVADPGLWGVFHPTIVAPKGLMERLEDPELETLFLHELVHARRYDNLSGFLQRMICSFFWFHPLVWRMDQRKREEMEVRCDERVIELGGDPNAYLQCIKKVLEFGMGQPLAGMSQAAGSNLRRRIEYMKSMNFRNSEPRRGLATGVVLGALVLVMAALALAPVTDASPLRQPNESLYRHEWKGGIVEPPPPDWEQLLSAPPAHNIHVESSGGAPITITGANARWVKFDGYYAFQLKLLVENTGNRKVMTADFESWNQRTGAAIKFQSNLINQERGQSSAIHHVWFFEGEDLPFLDQAANQLAIKITDVQYMDVVWHEKLLRKFQREPNYQIRISKASPNAVPAADLAPAFATGLQNPPGAPVSLNQGLIRVVEIWQVREKNVRVLHQLKLRLNNPGGRPLAGCIVKINHVSMQPHGHHILRIPREQIPASESDETSPACVTPYTVGIGGAPKIEQIAHGYTVSLVGAEYADGSFWFAAEAPDRILDLNAERGFFARVQQPEDVTGPPQSPVARSEVTTAPYFVGGMRPTYTEQARAKRVTGLVVLDVVISADGIVGEIQMREGLPYGLTEQAIGAAKRAHFRPARIKDREVSMRSTIAYQFSLD